MSSQDELPESPDTGDSIESTALPTPGEPAMALIERDGKVYARQLWIYLGDNEWGNELMWQVASEALVADASLDAVQVNEHAGWYLTFLRDGTIVDTANDQAHLSDK